MNILSGYRTYIICSLALVLLLADANGWFKVPPMMIEACAIAALALIRAAVASQPKPEVEDEPWKRRTPLRETQPKPRTDGPGAAGKAILPLLLVGAILASGCNTTNTSGRLLATTVQTVDSAMQGWATYVALGHASAEQNAAVKAAYEKYQLAEAAAERAYVAGAKTSDQSAFNVAAVALKASQADLLKLIATFNPPPK